MGRPVQCLYSIGGRLSMQIVSSLMCESPLPSRLLGRRAKPTQEANKLVQRTFSYVSVLSLGLGKDCIPFLRQSFRFPQDSGNCSKTRFLRFTIEREENWKKMFSLREIQKQRVIPTLYTAISNISTVSMPVMGHSRVSFPSLEASSWDVPLHHWLG